METSTVMATNYLIQQNKLIKQKQSKTLQLGNCVVQNVKIHGNKGSFGYETLYFNELS